MAGRNGSAPAAWRSRIVGHDNVDPTQLLANPRNWRIHPARQRDALRGSLDEVGWVTGILVNTTTGHVVDGHARVEEAISREEATVPITYVELTEEEERTVLAVLDPIGALASPDRERLQDLLGEVTVDSEGLRRLLENLRPGGGDAYTGTIVVPRYEVTEEVAPDLSELYDESRTDELRAAIRAADLEPAVRDFLLAAAGRHTVFRYDRIAEYYAHAPAEVQHLMEESALVILDYEDAIRLGYVRFTELVEALEEADHEAPRLRREHRDRPDA